MNKILKFPVKIITAKDKIQSYAETLINGEEQLLITRDCSLYLTDGKGGYSEFKTINSGVTLDQIENLINALRNEIDGKINDNKDNMVQLREYTDSELEIIHNAINQLIDSINTELQKYTTKEQHDNDIKSITKKILEDTHSNIEILNKFSENENGELLYNGKSISASGEQEINITKFQSIKQNVKKDETYTIELKHPNESNDLIVQIYEFVQGEKDIVTTIKEFNNSDSDNFYYDKEKLSFTDEGVKIKNQYYIESTKDKDTGLNELCLSEEGFVGDVLEISLSTANIIN